MINARTVVSSFLKEAYDFSSVQCQVPREIADKVYNWSLENIPDEDLVDDGREDDIHITVKYGIHNTDFTQVRDFLMNQKSIPIRLGKISIFDTDEADVVKIEVDSSPLHELNSIISNNMEVTDTYPQYIPHLTLAYVKKGLGRKYDGMDDFDGTKFIANSVLFSGKDNRRTLMNFPNL